MKYYQLFIDTDNNAETYNRVTDILGLQPTKSEKNKTSEDRYSTWMYIVTETETDPYFDFINNFLDILEPKFANLEKLGVTRDKILFWKLYEYDQQCGMEFHPQEMVRLGQSGIHLNIDCWTNNTEESTTA
ncbi:hypothetical protein [Echinicola sp. 20G]|uniref:hypothetical protein n=1 Tax=Echinicola sp. 20G TaxID=2781961 RepID=UPI001910D1A2|nr:hypothetical protein [Echinicola sp. 20G]